MDNTLVGDIYGKTRAHIEHEDMLINYRLTWLLMTNAFLFTAYVLSLNCPNGQLSDSEYIRSTISIAGLCSSLFLLIGIAAAARSMWSYVKGWDEFRNREDVKKLGIVDCYPIIIGNLRKNFFGASLGLFPAFCLPLILFASWCAVIMKKNQSIIQVISNPYFYGVITIAIIFYFIGRITSNKS